MSYIIRTRCPNGCKYKSGDTCIASECQYQTGDVRYDIRLNAEDKPTKINAEVKRALKQFAERLKDKVKNFCETEEENHYYDVSKEGACEEIDETLKEFINKKSKIKGELK